MQALSGMLRRQATTLAFGDAFAILAVACAFAAFVTLLSRPVKVQSRAAPSEIH